MTTATLRRSPSRAEFVLTDSIEPNAWNQKRELDPAFIDSIADQGVLSPIMLRPIEGGASEYEIVCGERRWRAARKLGLVHVPALIRVMDDQEARLCTLIENTHRENVTPWQEAKLIVDLLSRPDWDIAQAAAATGWTESLIRRRAKLVDLSPSWKNELESGTESKFPSWTIGHFETLTIFSEEKQEDLYSDLEYNGGALTVTKLRKEISNYTKTLKGAPWKLDDATLDPHAGSCTDCTMRTGANADLFQEPTKGVSKDDQCLNRKCFDTKGEMYMELKESLAREKHPNMIKIAKEWVPRQSGLLQTGEFEPAKKSDDGAVPAFVINGKGEGKVEYVRVIKGEAPERREKIDPIEKKKLAHESRRDALAINKLSKFIEAMPSKFKKESLAIYTQYALAYGVSVDIDDTQEARILWFKKSPYTVEEIWLAVKDSMTLRLSRIAHGGYGGLGVPVTQNTEINMIAWMVDADFEAMKKEADAELPIPNSWGKAKATAKVDEEDESEDDDDEADEDQ